MDARGEGFNRALWIVLVVLLVLSLAGFTYLNYRAESAQSVWRVLPNTLILSLPLVLFYGALYVLIRAWREHSRGGEISPRLTGVIRWAPRAAAVVIILFISLFSLDVFGGEGTLLEQLGAFFMHNLPSIFMILLLIVAWRRPVVGFVAFLLAGIVFLRFLFGGGGLPHFLLFSGPLLLTAALFYVDWRWMKPIPPAAGSV